ncbi:hypothetical protein CDCA_CDCA01G0126 [Cyanidium caldarium]|uniref:Complex 1 LYR protein domain-containing protein n=1 Tax=Cyanidium caldarium TaxID=2771 RepID=A0AAV9IPT8_CYACA|nr:hypothetical protein CDCA_CDCA01G0126 [Cyanidium caldarium]
MGGEGEGARDPSRRVYTDTGGSGRDSTEGMSRTPEEAHRRVLALYRECLRAIPQMKNDYTLSEDWQTLRDVLRDQFVRNADVRDMRVVDILVFKGRQELMEVKAQWKARHHVMQYISHYEERVHQMVSARHREKMAREAAQAQADAVTAEAGAAPVDTDADPLTTDPQVMARRRHQLREWRRKKVTPDWVLTWEQYLKWRAEEEAKFRAFAVANGLFSTEELEQNRQYVASMKGSPLRNTQCRVM